MSNYNFYSLDDDSNLSNKTTISVETIEFMHPTLAWVGIVLRNENNKIQQKIIREKSLKLLSKIFSDWQEMLDIAPEIMKSNFYITESGEKIIEYWDKSKIQIDISSVLILIAEVMKNNQSILFIEK